MHLSGDRPRIKRHTENLEAYNLYLQGRYYLLKETPDGLAKGRQYCEQAIAADSDYALPWCSMTLFWWNQGYAGVLPAKIANAKCLEAALKALELDDMLPLAHSWMGLIKATQFDWEGSEREFRRA